MTAVLSTRVLVSLVVLSSSLVIGTSNEPSEPTCDDRGESMEAAVSVVEGEVGWLSCPLFSHPSIYNYTSSQNAGTSLTWYRLPERHDRGQPITSSSQLSGDGQRLWLQPAAVDDAGLYVCELRNKSSCSKITMRLKVLRPDEVVRDVDCEFPVATTTGQVLIPLQQGKVLDCPDLQEATKIYNSEPTVTWLHVSKSGVCEQYPFWNKNRQQIGTSLHVHIMYESFQGLYYCRVQYQRGGQTLGFSRRLNVTAVSPTTLPKEPSILSVVQDQDFPVKRNSEVRLLCRALIPYLDSQWDIWWTVDGKTLENLSDTDRFSTSNRQVKSYFLDRTEESVLVIKDFQSEDLKREFNCSVRNPRGFDTWRAELQEEVLIPSVELGCGLGVTLVLMLLLFVLYHVFWLELLLLYRSWFGTDERHSDDKQYDVYISYARNSEDEQFVLSTLRSVLENQLGFSVCIFDRDSLPGGTITDETLSFVARSRRLLVVISPGYASQGSQALLELKAGIDSMALGGHLRVILIQYKPVWRQGWVRELRRARVALALVRWQGDKSRELTSRFWKRLRVELPVRRVSSGEEAALTRLQSQNSTSSQTGVITSTFKDPQEVLNSAVKP